MKTSTMLAIGIAVVGLGGIGYVLFQRRKTVAAETGVTVGAKTTNSYDVLSQAVDSTGDFLQALAGRGVFDPKDKTAATKATAAAATDQLDTPSFQLSLGSTPLR